MSLSSNEEEPEVVRLEETEADAARFFSNKKIINASLKTNSLSNLRHSR